MNTGLTEPETSANLAHDSNAIEAAIEAIERNGYRLSLPMQFRFLNESEAEMARYPQGQQEISRVEERGPAYSGKRRKTS